MKRITKCISHKMILAFLLIFSLTTASNLFAIDDDEETDHWVDQLIQCFRNADRNLYLGVVIIKFQDEINLTETQQKKIEQLILAHQEKILRQSAEIKIAEFRLATLVNSSKDQIDRNEAARRIKEISEKKTDLVVIHMNYLLDLRETLTPEQLEILKQILRKKAETLRQKSKRQIQDPEPQISEDQPS